MSRRADPRWRADALCATTDPEAFFPERGENATLARRICRSCNVQGECLDYALEHDEQFGIWGGTTRNERRAMRRDGRR